MSKDNYPPIHAYILAAGTSSRMGTENKLLLPLKGKAIIRHAVENMLAVKGIQSITIVIGHQKQEIINALDDFPINFIFCQDYKKGMGHSLAFAARHCLTQQTEDASPSPSLLLSFGDLPFIPHQIVEKLIDHFHEENDQKITLPIFQDQQGKIHRGHPIIWPYIYLDELTKLKGDQGAKVIIKNNWDNLLKIKMQERAIIHDIDNKTAYEAVE